MHKALLPVLFAAATLWAEPALTIYNGGFAVVRDTLPIELKQGVSQVTFAGATARLEPDSVILRDLVGKVPFQILEQSYRNDPISQPMLLSFFEGKSIDFVRRESTKPDQVIKGKVVRSGYVPGGEFTQPIIDVDGKLQFSLPGEPVFPALGEDNVLKPCLNWKLVSPTAAKITAEVAYVTQGFSWSASYNLVAEEKGDQVDLVGWITMRNESGTAFQDAKIKLMAGEVNKVTPPKPEMFAMSRAALADAGAPVVSEKAFDEFRLYTLAQPTSLRDRETKQVEFVRATGIKAARLYTYEGAEGANEDKSSKVQVYREFKNTLANHLGIPLPMGRARFYSQDTDRQLEFVGEDNIAHTPRDEMIRLHIGSSFDLVGERRVVSAQSSQAERKHTEVREVKLRNKKKEPVTILVIEHLNWSTNWTIAEPTAEFKKRNAGVIEFALTVQPDEEKTLTYKVNFTR